MRYYETLYIVNPNLENEALDITMGEIGTELEKSKSKLINHRVWGKHLFGGTRRMPFGPSCGTGSCRGWNAS